MVSERQNDSFPSSLTSNNIFMIIGGPLFTTKKLVALEHLALFMFMFIVYDAIMNSHKWFQFDNAM